MPTVDRGDQLCDSGAAAFIRCHTYAICIRRNVITALATRRGRREAAAVQTVYCTPDVLLHSFNFTALCAGQFPAVDH